MKFWKRILEKKQNNCVIDFKQQFTGFKKNYLDRKYLYEFNFKTTMGMISENHLRFLHGLTLFNETSDIKYKILHIWIPDNFVSKDFSGWNLFKFTVALNKKIALNVVEDYLLRNIKDNTIELISSRIVINENKVDCDEYFPALVKHLSNTYPGVYTKNTIMILEQPQQEND
jgi:hypothetical protein